MGWEVEGWGVDDGKKGVRQGRLTDGVNDLMDHDLTKLKPLVLAALVTDILGDGDVAVALAREAIAPAAIHHAMLVVVVVAVEGADARRLADAAVAHGAGPVMLPAEVEGLEEEQDRHARDGHQHEHDLQRPLTAVQRLLDLARRQEHVDERVQQPRRRLPDRVPVDAPFVHDREDEVAKDGLEEDQARDEVAPDVDGRSKVPGVDVGEHKRIRHLMHRSAEAHQRRRSNLVCVEKILT